MMEAVRTSETSVSFNVTTQINIPEDSKLHTRRRENLKSHPVLSSTTRAAVSALLSILSTGTSHVFVYVSTSSTLLSSEGFHTRIPVPACQQFFSVCIIAHIYCKQDIDNRTTQLLINIFKSVKRFKV
jgi:hypothetical protein